MLQKNRNCSVAAMKKKSIIVPEKHFYLRYRIYFAIAYTKYSSRKLAIDN